ncbi:hypothetical protein BC828DRAFT_189899 [Blastocladiella britannica]|nr:hypothetical protein BC828DRAFT_189899 [Blastocladiella britannica]
MIGSDFSKNIEDPVWVRVVRTIVAIGCVDTIAIASLGIFAHPPGHAWHDSPVVITLSVTSFVAAAGIINVFRPRFWYALILSIRDTVLVIVGAALYFPVFVVILLVTNHYRCVLHLGRYITSPGSSPRTGTAAARAALSLVVTWGSFAAAYIIAHPLLPMIKTVAVSLGALCVMNAVTVVVLRQFNQSLFIISGWPIETSTRLPETEIRAINTHFTTSIHLAKHGKRTDPLKEIRFVFLTFFYIPLLTFNGSDSICATLAWCRRTNASSRSCTSSFWKDRLMFMTARRWISCRCAS